MFQHGKVKITANDQGTAPSYVVFTEKEQLIGDAAKNQMFDLDANGILNVSAKEMGTGNANNIVIKNDRGRMSHSDIDCMQSVEDEKHRGIVAERNGLEGYVFSASLRRWIGPATNWATEKRATCALNTTR